jgi:Tol biopolymer transport system component
LRTERLAWPGGGAFSRVSPDGRLATFHDGQNLAIRDMATGKVRRLSTDGVESGRPGEQYALASAFSPDSRHVAYEWWFESENRSVLRTVETRDGAVPRPQTLVDNPDIQSFAPTDWSPDGQWISAVVRRQDRTAQIVLVHARDGALRVLKSVDWSGVGGLRFSRDSTRLAYHRPSREGAFERDVFVIATDGSREVAVARSPADDLVLEWTPGGDRLLIASDRAGSMGIWAVSFDAGVPRGSLEPIKSDVGNIASKALTPDGVLYYDLAPATANIYVAALNPSTGTLGGSPVQPVHQFKGANTQPEWSPDGKELAFVSRREVPAPINVARPVVGILSMETGAVREVFPALSYMGFPRWSPDGTTFIARGADLKGRSGIVRIDATTGAASLVVPNEVCSGLPYWAPDGESFFCYRFAEEAIAQVNARSGAVIKLLPSGTQGAGVSPDGQYILSGGDAEPRSLVLIPTAGGSPRELLRLDSSDSRLGNLSSVAFTPDSRFVVFGATLRGENGVWVLPLDGGTPPKKVDVGLLRVSTLRISRTGQMAFSPDVVPPLELWKMERFLATHPAQ